MNVLINSMLQSLHKVHIYKLITMYSFFKYLTILFAGYTLSRSWKIYFN